MSQFSEMHGGKTAAEVDALYPAGARVLREWPDMTERQRSRALAKLPPRDFQFFTERLSRQAEDEARAAAEAAAARPVRVTDEQRLVTKIAQMHGAEFTAFKAKMALPAFDPLDD